MEVLSKHYSCGGIMNDFGDFDWGIFDHILEFQCWVVLGLGGVTLLVGHQVFVGLCFFFISVSHITQLGQ